MVRKGTVPIKIVDYGDEKDHDGVGGEDRNVDDVYDDGNELV